MNITAILKSAEKITGQAGCVSFEGVGWQYPAEIIQNSPSIIGKRIELFSCSNHNFYYDYECRNPCMFLKKEWLEDIREEVDWSTVEVDTKVIVWDIVFIDKKHRHFAKYENGKVYTCGDGLTSWSYKDKHMVCWDYAELAEE